MLRQSLKGTSGPILTINISSSRGKRGPGEGERGIHWEDAGKLTDSIGAGTAKARTIFEQSAPAWQKELLKREKESAAKAEKA